MEAALSLPGSGQHQENSPLTYKQHANTSDGTCNSSLGEYVNSESRVNVSMLVAETSLFKGYFQIWNQN